MYDNASGWPRRSPAQANTSAEDAMLQSANQKNVAAVVAAAENGARLAAADFNGYTPLHVAADKGDLEMTKALLALGSDTNLCDDNCSYTALHIAASQGYPNSPSVLQALLDAGADPSARDDDGKTAMMIARYDGFDDSVAVLARELGRAQPRRN